MKVQHPQGGKAVIPSLFLFQVEFMWSVNTSQGWKELEASSFTTQGLVSTLRHRPHEFDFAEDQFGAVLCQGSNSLGNLDSPCVFTVTEAGKVS